MAADNRLTAEPGTKLGRARPFVLVLGVVSGLTLGIGLTIALTRGPSGGASSNPLDLAEPTPLTTPTDEGPPPPGAAATSPQAAVEGFLSAEIAGDLTASFGYLSEMARRGFGSPEAWTAAHADLLPPVTGYEIEQVAPPGADGEAEVVALVEFEPGLDEVVGLVPERSRVTWATAGQDGSWGVDLAATTLEPQYLSDESAPAAVEAWAEAHQECRPAPSWDGNLLGSPALAERLCGAPGAVEVGDAGPLSSVDSAPFFAAFGPEAAQWARVVPVTAPVPLRAVVAPIGQEWLVIGVLK